MSTIYHINSFHRNQDTILEGGSESNSPFYFSTEGESVSGWKSSAPKVTSGSCSSTLGRSEHTITTYVEDWKSSLRLQSVMVPYSAVREYYDVLSPPPALPGPQQEYPTPTLYISISQNTGGGNQYLGITNGLLPSYSEVTFVAKLQTDKHILDDAGNILFCYYRPLHSQLVSFVRNRDFVIKIQKQSEGDLEILINRYPLPSGDAIPDTDPPNKILQSQLTFTEVPYIRDADFVNHEFELYRS